MTKKGCMHSCLAKLLGIPKISWFFCKNLKTFKISMRVVFFPFKRLDYIRRWAFSEWITGSFLMDFNTAWSNFLCCNLSASASLDEFQYSLKKFPLLYTVSASAASWIEPLCETRLLYYTCFHCTLSSLISFLLTSISYKRVHSSSLALAAAAAAAAITPFSLSLSIVLPLLQNQSRKSIVYTIYSSRKLSIALSVSTEKNSSFWFWWTEIKEKVVVSCHVLLSVVGRRRIAVWFAVNLLLSTHILLGWYHADHFLH